MGGYVWPLYDRMPHGNFLQKRHQIWLAGWLAGWLAMLAAVGHVLHVLTNQYYLF